MRPILGGRPSSGSQATRLPVARAPAARRARRGQALILKSIHSQMVSFCRRTELNRSNTVRVLIAALLIR